jgi:hypothetical protein
MGLACYPIHGILDIRYWVSVLLAKRANGIGLLPERSCRAWEPGPLVSRPDEGSVGRPSPHGGRETFAQREKDAVRPELAPREVPLLD